MSWPDGSTLRRTAVARRTRRRFLATAAAAVVGAGVVTGVALNYDGNPPRTAPRPVVLADGQRVAARLPGAAQLVADVRPLAGSPADAAAVARANQAFTVDLLRHAGVDGNRTLSPWSLYVALGMLLNTARGQTATELAQVLNAPGGVASVNQGLAALTSQLASAGTVTSANSLWTQQGLPVPSPLLAALGQYYRAGVWQTDFHTDTGRDAVNAWAAQQTHGVVPKLFDDLSRDTVAVLANAVYFHDAWAVPFATADTSLAPFFPAGGGSVTVPTMHSDNAQLLSGPGYTGARLAYRHGGLTATVVLPNAPLEQYVDGLTPTALTAILRAPTVQGELALPRITTQPAAQNLKPLLSAMGMPSAFDPNRADLSGLAPDLFVDQLVQRAALDVTEQGTTAAAATGIGVSPASLSTRSVTVDRPFLFLITDTSGAVVFASEITDPAA